MSSAMDTMNLTDRELLIILHTRFDHIERGFDNRFELLEEDMKKFAASQQEVDGINRELTIMKTTLLLQKEYQEKGNQAILRWVGLIGVLLVIVQLIVAVFDWKVKVLPH